MCKTSSKCARRASKQSMEQPHIELSGRCPLEKTDWEWKKHLLESPRGQDEQSNDQVERLARQCNVSSDELEILTSKHSLGSSIHDPDATQNGSSIRSCST